MNAQAPRETEVPDPPAARYEQVKSHIRRTIDSGARQPGDRIPSELDLVAALGAIDAADDRPHRRRDSLARP
jgi:DNA-binding GntR family transcriptional regulator